MKAETVLRAASILSGRWGYGWGADPYWSPHSYGSRGRYRRGPTKKKLTKEEIRERRKVERQRRKKGRK